MRRRRVAVVTTTRAEYGMLRYIIEALAADPRADVRVIVGGAHLDPRSGRTISEIRRDGIRIAARVPFIGAGDTGRDHARSASRALEGFARAFASGDPDIVVVLGDRYEILAAAIAAALEGRIVAHLHGGEVTAGSLDEGWRHAITKIAHLHLPATREFARRIRAMGEEGWRIRVVGAPTIERMKRETRLSRREVEALLGRELVPPVALVTYHPVTTDPVATARETGAMLAAIGRAALGTVVFTAPNTDAGANEVRRRIERAARRDPRAVFVASLGARAYHSTLALSDVVVGNSSSGIIEAPTFHVPVVNIGARQEGRPRAANVIDVEGDAALVGRAIQRALSPAFRRRLRGLRSPYGSGRTSELVRSFLLDVPIDARLRRKRFADP